MSQNAEYKFLYVHTIIIDSVEKIFTFPLLPDALKVMFIKYLLPLLSNNGTMLIGDIGFPGRAELEECKKQNASGWDDDEYYFVFSELIDALKGICEITFEQASHCGGVIEIRMRYRDVSLPTQQGSFSIPAISQAFCVGVR